MSDKFVAPEDAQWVCTPNHLAYRIIGGQMMLWRDGWIETKTSIETIKAFVEVGDPKKLEDANKYFFDKSAGNPYLLLGDNQ